MTKIDEKEIARLRALVDEAEPAPWVVRSQYCDVIVREPDDWRIVVKQDHSHEGSLAFVAEARTALPALLDEIERLRGNLAELRGETEMSVKVDTIPRLRGERDAARAQAAGMRTIIEQHECAPCPGFDRGVDGQDRVRRIALATDAGRDIIDALAKAEAALRIVAGKMETIADGDHAWLFMESNVWGDIPADDLATLVTSEDARNTIAALAAIQALGIRGDA